MRIIRFIPALVAVAVVVVVVLLVTGSGSGSGYAIKINLADADGLRPGSRVEIGGVSVGTVNTLQITPQDHALATITVNHQDEPIGRDATVEIEPADLLGEKFLNLSVGNRTQPAPSGYTIPTAQTSDATDFDQVLDVLAPTERDRLAVMIHETGVALFGRGADLASLLNALPPSLADAQQLISQVTASNTQLKGLITHTAHVMSTLDTQQGALSHFVATAANAMSATAANTRGLSDSVAEAPGLLSQLRSTLIDLDSAGAKLRPAAVGLEQTAPGLTATLEALPGFAQAAQPTLSEVHSIAPQLTSLGTQAAPVIARLEPVSRQLETVATDAAPVTGTLDTNVDDLLETMQNWARAIQYSDGLSHEFRVSAEVTPQLESALLPIILGSVTAARTGTKATKPDSSGLKSATSSAVSSAASGVSTTVKKVTSGAGSGVAKTLSGLSQTLANVGSTVSGLLGAGHGGSSKTTTTTSSQTTTSSSSLGNLLGYLLGGR